MCEKLHLEDIYGIERKILANVGEDWSVKQNCKHADFGRISLKDDEKNLFLTNY
jgi:hypothetical protein